MRSDRFMWSLLFCTALLAPAFAKSDFVTEHSKPFLQMKLETVKLAHGIEMLSGYGGNIIAVTGAQGTLLIDDGVPPRAADLAKTLAGEKARPVTTVVNTHFHFDHTGGNEYFATRGATIIAQENVTPRLINPTTLPLFGAPFPKSPAIALPTVTFKTDLALNRNGHNILLHHPAGTAHTDGDVFAVFPDDNIIQTGDLLFNGFYPLIDESTGGWIGGMVAADDEILALAKDDTKIIPGHGDVASKADLKAFRDMLASVQDNVTKLIGEGKTEDEAVAAKPTAAYDAQWGKGFFSPEQFTRIAYRGIKSHQQSAPPLTTTNTN